MPGTTRDATQPASMAPAAPGLSTRPDAAARQVSGGGAVEMVSVAGASGRSLTRTSWSGDPTGHGHGDRTAPSAGSGPCRPRHRDRRQQVDLVKDRGPTTRQCSTRPRATGCGFSTTRLSSTSRLHRRADAEVLETRQDRAHEADARSDAGAQQVCRSRDRRESTGEPRQNTRPHPLRGADRRGAAVVCLLHQRRHDAPFLVRAVPREQAAREIRVRRDADPDPGTAAREGGRAPKGAAGANARRSREGRRRQERGTGRPY